MKDARHAIGSTYTALPVRPTVETWMTYWLAYMAWPRLRFTTARTYASVTARVIVPVLGRIPVRRLKSADIERAQLVWERSGVTASMRRKAVEVLRSALGPAAGLALCEQNVARRCHLPAKGNRTAVWLERDTARSLLDDARGHALEAAYALAIGLRLRRGEIAGLTWADVDLPGRRLWVRWNRVEHEHGTRLAEPKTAASRRLLAMPELVRQALKTQLARERAKAARLGAVWSKSDPVLTTRTRHPLWNSYLYADLRKRLDRLGLPRMRFHDLRHTAASLMLGQGVPPRTVMEMMGHRNLEVTMLIYGHASLGQQRDAARRMDRALRRRRKRT